MLTINARTQLALALIAVFLAACSTGDARGSDASSPETKEPVPTTAPRTDVELAAAWWSWAASEPDPTNPVVDETGEDCTRNQPDDVRFLAGNFGGTTQRSCSVPAGRDLFFPVLNAICSEGDGCEFWFDDAEVSVVLDGASVEPTEIDTGLVEIDAAAGNSVTGADGRFRAVVAGWWVRMPAPTAGSHQLEIYGLAKSGFEVTVTYDLTIG